MAQKKEEDTQKVQLLCSWASAYSIRVQIALALKGIEYEKLPQDLSQKSPLLLASNPVYKKIPVLLHGDRAISESSIIIQYIDEAFHDQHHHHHQFLPEDAYGRATARFWADFVDKKVFDGLIQVLLLQGEAQKAAIQNALASFETLDQALGKVSGGLPYFGGENLGFVDLMFAPLVCWSPAIEAAGEFKIPFEDKYPHLHAWLHAFKQSSVSSVLPEPEKVTEFAINVLRKAALSS